MKSSIDNGDSNLLNSLTKPPSVFALLESRLLKYLVKRSKVTAPFQKRLYRLSQGSCGPLRRVAKAGHVQIRGQAYVNIPFSEYLSPVIYCRSTQVTLLRGTPKCCPSDGCFPYHSS